MQCLPMMVELKNKERKVSANSSVSRMTPGDRQSANKMRRDGRPSSGARKATANSSACRMLPRAKRIRYVIAAGSDIDPRHSPAIR